MTQMTIEEVHQYLGNKAVRAALRRAKIDEKGTYQEFMEQLYDDIDESIYALQATRELRQTDSEDRIINPAIK